MTPHRLATIAQETADALVRAGMPLSASVLRALPAPGADGWLYTWCSTIASVIATAERRRADWHDDDLKVRDALAECFTLLAAVCNEVESDLRGRAA